MPFDKSAKMPLSEVVGTVVSGDSSQFIVVGEQVGNPGKYTFSYFAGYDMIADVIPGFVRELPLAVQHLIVTRCTEALLAAAHPSQAEDNSPRIQLLDS
jgi:rRNA maturation protein Rpf1